MDWTSVLAASISGLAMVFAAAVGLQVKRSNARTEKRAARRAEESRLSMAMQSAGLKLALVTAKKVMHQETNGDVEAAMEAAALAQADYEQFIHRTAAEQVSKF